MKLSYGVEPERISCGETIVRRKKIGPKKRCIKTPSNSQSPPNISQCPPSRLDGKLNHPGPARSW